MWIIFLLLLLIIVYFFSSWVKNIRSKDFAANEVKFVQKKFSAHKENLLNEMPKSSEDTSDNGKSR
jgi:Na+-transporting methylmalonyl-CoA/oxaloacetate decarboxylase gamma subunit